MSQQLIELTLYKSNYMEWYKRIFHTSEECLTAHMKLFLLRWDDIQEWLTSQGKTNEEGYTLVNYAYLAKCYGVSLRTMRRTITDMHIAEYLDKLTEPAKETEFGFEREMRIKVLRCCWDCEFHPLPHRNKGRGQKNFFCQDCGSTNVEVTPLRLKMLCYDCGSVAIVDNESHKIIG